MKPATWRAILLTCCAGGALLVLIAVFDQIGIAGAAPWYGMWGGYFVGSSEPYHLSVHGIDPGGPIDRAGIREGDLIDVRDRDVLVRVTLMGQPIAGRPLSLQVKTAAGTARRTVVPAAFYISRFWNYAIWELVVLWLLLFAVLIAWRRPYVGNNLLLATVLASAAIGFSSSMIFFAWPWVWPYVVIALIGQASQVAVALWATLASAFARPLSRARRVAVALCYTLVAISMLIGWGTPDFPLGIAPLLGTLTLWFDPTIFFSVAWMMVPIAAIAAAIACSGLTLLAARGVERQRAGWLLVPCTIFFCAQSTTTVGVHVLSYAGALGSGYAFGAAAAVTPLVLTYAALNRRLIDAGFVLNRTVVFAIVSTIVIGAFVLVEWAAGAWLVNASHTTSAVVGMVVALALGLSLRYIHRYVDKFVDSMLFRKRHEDETALRRFAHEASHISDRETLLKRAIQTVHDHTTTEMANILIRNGSATYVPASAPQGAEISENDPALVALAAWNKPVDLHHVSGSEVSGELAFPMASRGQLVGALVCGPKREGEAYAPDETEALATLAHGVGGALDVLDARGEESSEATMAELVKLVRALPDALAERLLSAKQ